MSEEMLFALVEHRTGFDGKKIYTQIIVVDEWKQLKIWHRHIKGIQQSKLSRVGIDIKLGEVDTTIFQDRVYEIVLM